MIDSRNFLENLPKEKLIELIEMQAKNVVAMDGVWFQIIEEQEGMDRAMEVDAEAWNRYPHSEGRRIKKFLNLPEHPGLEGLEKALLVYYNSIANEVSVRYDGDALILRTEVCRVQAARSRKGMEYHPCKPVGMNEYANLARAIDDRIQVECLSCYPEVTDATCSCSWRFTLSDE